MPAGDANVSDDELTPPPSVQGEPGDQDTGHRHSGGQDTGHRHSGRRNALALSLMAVWGPGLIVMLADTDAGCLITAAQSGAQWDYSMVLPQLVLIPILFMAQEIVVRLGISACTWSPPRWASRRGF